MYVGSLGQSDEDAEPGSIDAAWGIMKGGRINFHGDSSRDAEGFHLCRIQLAIDNFLATGKQQDEILVSQIQFRIAVKFQTIEFLVMTAAKS